MIDNPIARQIMQFGQCARTLTRAERRLIVTLVESREEFSLVIADAPSDIEVMLSAVSPPSERIEQLEALYSALNC